MIAIDDSIRAIGTSSSAVSIHITYSASLVVTPFTAVTTLIAGTQATIRGTPAFVGAVRCATGAATVLTNIAAGTVALVKAATGPGHTGFVVALIGAVDTARPAMFVVIAVLTGVDVAPAPGEATLVVDASAIATTGATGAISALDVLVGAVDADGRAAMGVNNTSCTGIAAAPLAGSAVIISHAAATAVDAGLRAGLCGAVVTVPAAMVISVTQAASLVVAPLGVWAAVAGAGAAIGCPAALAGAVRYATAAIACVASLAGGTVIVIHATASVADTGFVVGKRRAVCASRTAVFVAVAHDASLAVAPFAGTATVTIAVAAVTGAAALTAAVRRTARAAAVDTVFCRGAIASQQTAALAVDTDLVAGLPGAVATFPTAMLGGIADLASLAITPLGIRTAVTGAAAPV